MLWILAGLEKAEHLAFAQDYGQLFFLCQLGQLDNSVWHSHDAKSEPERKNSQFEKSFRGRAVLRQHLVKIAVDLVGCKPHRNLVVT